MNLTALFLSMCLNTGLPCEDINVGFGQTPTDIMGTAQLYNTGRMDITISTLIEDSAYKTRETLAHEVAHLVVYSNNLKKGQRLNWGHNHHFMVACKKVSRSVGMNPKHCSKGAH